MSVWQEITNFRYEIVQHVTASSKAEALAKFNTPPTPPEVRVVAVVLPDGREQRCAPVPCGCKVWLYRDNVFAIPHGFSPDIDEACPCCTLPDGSHCLVAARGGEWFRQ